jgi:hypothetical protein
VIGSNDSAMISSIIASFTRQNEELMKSLLQLQYYFRGSLTRDDALAMSFAEREIAIEFLNGRFKEAGELMKRQIPVFL